VETAFWVRAARDFAYGLHLRVPTQETSLSPALNRAGLNFGFAWARVEGGNIAPSLSKYTMQGVTLRGGWLELKPGRFLFSATAGQVEDEVDPLSDLAQLAPRYQRWIYAGTIGVGQTSGRHVHLTALLGRDDADPIDEAQPRPPAENLTVSPDVGFSAFGGRFKLRAIGALSAFTRDSQGEALDLSDTPVPGWFTDLFALTTSTQVDFAGEVISSLKLPGATLNGGYERVQPGYESMGLPRSRNDFERIRGRGQFTLLNRRLRLSTQFNQQRNNLLGLLSSTRTRRRVQLGTSAQLSEQLGLSVQYGLTQNLTEVEASATRGTPRDIQMHSVTLAPTYTMQRGGTTHTLGLTTAYQTSADRDAGATDESAVDVLNVGTTYALVLPSAWRFNWTAAYASVQAATSETLTLTSNAAANKGWLDNALTSGLSLQYALTDTELSVPDGTVLPSTRVSRVGLGLNLRYRVPFGGTAAFSLRTLRAAPAQGPSYQDLRATLSYKRRL